MADNPLHVRTAIDTTILVRFAWGSSSALLCGHTSPLVVGGGGVMAGTYTPEPTLEVELPNNHGGTEQPECFVSMRTSTPPFLTLATGFVHAPVSAMIGRCAWSDPDNTAELEHKGNIKAIDIDHDSQGGISRAEISGLKDRLGVQLGFYTNPNCEHRFGSTLCGIDVPSLAVVGTVSAVASPNLVSVTWGTPPAVDLERWRRGYLDVNGARVLIRSVSGTAPSVFEVSRVPPASWVGQSVTAYPGCDKQPETCEYWNNLDNILTPGRSIPAYNPAFSIG